jgi:hypothetical protein
MVQFIKKHELKFMIMIFVILKINDEGKLWNYHLSEKIDIAMKEKVIQVILNTKEKNHL